MRSERREGEEVMDISCKLFQYETSGDDDTNEIAEMVEEDNPAGREEAENKIEGGNMEINDISCETS